ncbi:hypothetical protein BDW71DRAFT_193502 [Aspergillus fruticulosus]
MPLEARVKSVLSGDTVVLSHIHNPAQERVLSLAYVSAPRLRREGDEPYAFQSREFLRELLVGKVVQFQALYSVPSSQREYGRIKLPTFEVTLPDIVVQEGWSRVREEAGKRSDDSEETLAMLERLRALEDHARTEGKGVWGTGNGRTETRYDFEDAKSLLDEWKDKHLEGIVEKVLTGDRLVVRLLVAPAEHLQVIVVVAGIRAPATKRLGADGKEQPAEPYGEEAQQFVESRLLQRKVQVSLLGVTPQGQLIATVVHPNGNIARYLLEAGLARCHDHHSPLLGAEMAEFRRSEKVARDARLGLFTGLVALKGPAGGVTEQDYIVGRVLNADTIFVRNKAGQEKKLSLSSIRQPKPSDPSQAPFAADAKEFLRKRIIGKHVKVTINGKKPATEGYEEREVATVVQGNTNVALALVQAGYASVIRHRQDDSDRSPIYDDLMIAEAEAQKDGKGMWSSKPPKTKQYQDYSENLQKAKMEVSILQRQKRIPAIVDFVKSGSRFTVLVPRENAKLTLVLSGIRAPRSARNPGEASEPFGNEAHELANRRCMQRDVEIDVETIDKVGGFIGTLYVNKENFTKTLLEEGLATVHAYSAEQSGHATEYFAAEQRAKEARKGLWHDWDPSKELEEEEATSGSAVETEATTRRKDYRDVMVTYVDPTTARVKLQQIGTGTSALTELMSAFRSFHINNSNDTPLPGPPKAGDFVAAKFTEDGEWYRAKIRRNDREKQQAEVLYIDYGNSEVLPWSALRPLSAQFSTQKLRPQAVDAVLSFIQFPVNLPHYLEEAVSYIEEQTYNRELVANVDYVAPEGTLHVTLLDPEGSKTLDQSINADIVHEGLATVPRKLKAWERAAGETLSNLRALEDEARESRRDFIPSNKIQLNYLWSCTEFLHRRSTELLALFGLLDQYQEESDPVSVQNKADTTAADPRNDPVASASQAASDAWLAGHLNHLTGEQEAKLAEFKALCEKERYYKPGVEGEKPSHDDATMLRFLRARRFDVNGAWGQFKDTEDWRKENAIEALYENIDVDSYEAARRMYPQWTGRRDRRGIPVYVFEIKHLNSKNMADYNATMTDPEATAETHKSSAVPQRLLRLFALYENLLNFVMPLCSKLPRPHPDTPIVSSNNIVDVSGVGLKQFWNLKGHMQDASVLATAHYPETLDRIFIIGAPAFFPTVWGWIKRWFDPVTTSKIFILSASEVLPTLTSFMEPSSIPKQYGGGLEWQWGDMPNLDEPARELIGALETAPAEGQTKPGFIKGPVLFKGDRVEVLGKENGKRRATTVPVPESKLAQTNGVSTTAHSEEKQQEQKSATEEQQVSEKAIKNDTARNTNGDAAPPT